MSDPMVKLAVFWNSPNKGMSIFRQSEPKVARLHALSMIDSAIEEALRADDGTAEIRVKIERKPATADIESQ